MRLRGHLGKISAFLACVLLLSGCGVRSAQESVQTVKWYVNAPITGNDREAVMERVNSILEKKYKLRLELVGIGQANYDREMQIINAGRETYDLAYTANWTNNYIQNVANGVFMELTEEDMKKYAPVTWENMSQAEKDAVTVNSKMYAVPNWQVQARSAGVFINEEFLKKTGQNVEDFKNLDDITGFLRKSKNLSPEVKQAGISFTVFLPYYGMVDIFEENIPGVVYYNKTGKPVVVNQYETAEFDEYCKLVKQWREEGLISNNAVTPQAMLMSPGVYKPGGAEENSNIYGIKFKAKQLSEAVISGSSITAAMTGVSATSKNPQAALRMIEVINTDAEVINLLTYGIEGDHYEKVSENQVKRINGGNYSGIRAFLLGSVANTYVLETQNPDQWEKTREFNESAIPSPLLGFNADTTPITLEIANCKTVIEEYYGGINSGHASDERIQEFKDKLKLAGVDKIISELQRQVDEWYLTVK